MVKVLEEILRQTTCRDGSPEQDDEVIRTIADMASRAISEDLFKDKLTMETKYPCPICGEQVTLTGERTKDGRLIGSCLDAFTVAQWLFDE
jgi:predicted RNA-binding Zn-ribbon protein involved in translation (DUF1610 family)